MKKLGRKGQMIDNGGVMALIYIAILIIVGLTVFSQIDTSISTSGLSAQALAARGNVSNNTYGGFQTVSVAPTVLAAVVILGIVGMLLWRRM